MIFLSLLAASALASAHHQDPTNGWEDYLRAGALLDDGLARLYSGWTPEQYEGLAGKPDTPQAKLTVAQQLDGLDYLRVQEAMVQRYGRALDFVRQGNLKGFHKTPPEDGNPLRREVKLFEVARLADADAYVRFSKGDWKGGTATLLDLLTMSERIRCDYTSSFLVSVAINGLIFHDFEQSLAYIGEREADRIVAFVSDTLSRPEGLIAAAEKDRSRRLSELDQVLAPPKGPPELAIEKFLLQMTPDQKRQAREMIVDSINRATNEITNRLKGPESNWYVRPTPVDYSTDRPVATVDEFVTRLTSLWDNGGVQVVWVLGDRARLRLLGLHARIADFRWKTGHLPSTLTEAVPASLIKDPCNDQEFQYELQDGGSYRLYSRGFGDTGDIELGKELPYSNQGKLPPVVERGSR